MTSKRLVIRLAFAAAALVCTGGASSAHEIGKTQVTATFDSPDAYRVEVVVDPDALLTKLEVFGGSPVSHGLARTERNRRIDALRRVFLSNASIWFDGLRSQPQFEFVPASSLNDLAQTPSVVRLTGVVPREAHDFAFAYGLAMGSYALNVRIAASPVQTLWINGTERSAAVSLVAPPPPPSGLQVAKQYFALGYTHILPKGLDHILFVVGIFLLSTRWRSILLQVSTFTVAHSITLGLTMYGVVSLPAKVVEPMIALSIAYVAVENLFTSELKPWRVALVFSFGLLHGMGFAGVLRDLGLPRSEFLTALVTFNVGVEAGQLSVIALAVAAVAYYRSNAVAYRRLVVQPASLLIAAVGLFWTIQRALP
jgi:hydrogenase/urease accessory protein HupE